MNRQMLVFSSTETGYNHIKVNRPCEDSSDYYSDQNMYICVVADGHGSSNYPRTDRGSELAVQAAISCIVEFVENANVTQVLNDESNRFDLLLQLSKSILNTWHQSVEGDYQRHPFSKEELDNISEKYIKKYTSENDEERAVEKAYGTTLIAFVVTEFYSFGIQIGDGRCIIIDEKGNCIEPIPWDENCQLNITTSLCDNNAVEEFRFCILDYCPTAVFCGSDGIDDSYTSDEELYALYRSILKIFIENGEEVGKKEIKEYLPILTRRGSGDDVSIGLIIDMEEASRIAPMIAIQDQIFKTNLEIEKKKHQLSIVEERRKSKTDTILKNFEFKSKNLREWANSADEFDKEQNEIQLQIQELDDKLAALYSDLQNQYENDNPIDESHTTNLQKDSFANFSRYRRGKNYSRRKSIRKRIIRRSKLR